MSLFVTAVHREVAVRFRLPAHWYSGGYARWCLPSVQHQAALLERLRVKWQYGPNDIRIMQHFGDVGRRLIQ